MLIIIDYVHVQVPDELLIPVSFFLLFKDKSGALDEVDCSPKKFSDALSSIDKTELPFRIRYRFPSQAGIQAEKDIYRGESDKVC